MKQIHSAETNKIYNVTIDKKHNHVSCTCLGYQNHRRCKHIKFYKDYIERVMYSSPSLIINMIKNFKYIKGKVKYVLLEKPELLEVEPKKENYEELFETVGNYFPEIKDKKTTIERTFRWLKSNDPEIIPLVPIEMQIKSEKQEQVMHDIDQWESSNVTSFAEKQTMLIEKEKFE